MRRYNTNYQLSHDIDWFFRYKNKVFHVASNGGEIPKYMRVDRNNNFDLQCLVFQFEEQTDEIETRKNKQGLDWSSFEFYAKRGFISIDKIFGEPYEQNYLVISKPEEPIQIEKTILEKIPALDEKYKDSIKIKDINGRDFKL